MFRETGPKILGRVGTHFFFWKKIYNFMQFEKIIGWIGLP